MGPLSRGFFRVGFLGSRDDGPMLPGRKRTAAASSLKRVPLQAEHAFSPIMLWRDWR